MARVSSLGRSRCAKRAASALARRSSSVFRMVRPSSLASSTPPQVSSVGSTPQAAGERRGEVERRAGRPAARVALRQRGAALGEQRAEERRVGVGPAQGGELCADAVEQRRERVLARRRGRRGRHPGGRGRASRSASAARLGLRRRASSASSALASRRAPLDDRRGLGGRLAVGARALGVGVGLDRAQQVGERHGQSSTIVMAATAKPRMTSVSGIATSRIARPASSGFSAISPIAAAPIRACA